MSRPIERLGSATNEKNPLHVVAGVWQRSDGRFLLQQRQDAHHDGEWEFPGGKVEPQETEREALVREWREELDVTITPGRFLGTVEHRYAHRHVRIAIYAVDASDQAPAPAHGQPVIWASRDEAVKDWPLAAADQKALRLIT